MKVYCTYIYCLFFLLFIGCKSETRQHLEKLNAKVEIDDDQKRAPVTEPEVVDYDVSRWSELSDENPGIIIDIRYATDNNFMEQQVYDCGRCFLEPRVAKRIKRIAQKLYDERGWGLKLYDCYRPKKYQQRLWDIKPDARYVTPPSRGSYHSRGLSVDLTIVDENGDILDMGTPYDSFSKLSHTNHRNLPMAVLENRDLLKKLMLDEGLKGIRTEWWHYSLYDKKVPLEGWIWNCN